MADYVAGALIAFALYFAVRHVYRNYASGKSDCCSCGCGCSGCHCGCSSQKEK